MVRNQAPVLENKNKPASIVYILERFPGDTLNFVYNEIRGIEKGGRKVEIYSILPGTFCPREAIDFVGRTHSVRPAAFRKIFQAWLYYIGSKPVTLMRLLLRLPFDNTENRAQKVVKTYGHLVYAVYFAWLLRDYKGHIHAHFAFKAALCAMVSARLNGGSFSFTAHGSATVYPPSQYSLRSKIDAADFIVAVSDFNKHTMLSLCPGCPSDKIVVNRTGIVLDEFPLREVKASVSNVIRIVCVATLYPVKNHAGLVNACGLLAERGIKFRLDLVGKDDMGLGETLKKMAREWSILNDIVFHGGVDHGDVAQFLEDADICILTSFSEGIPVSLMEAMARGVCVIGPRVTGVSELVLDGKTGLLVDPECPEEIADAIQLLGNDLELRQNMIVKARRHVECEYDMGKNSETLAETFNQLLSSIGCEHEE